MCGTKAQRYDKNLTLSTEYEAITTKACFSPCFLIIPLEVTAASSLPSRPGGTVLLLLASPSLSISGELMRRDPGVASWDINILLWFRAVYPWEDSSEFMFRFLIRFKLAPSQLLTELLNIEYLIFVLFSVDYNLKRICKSLNSVFIHTLTFLALGLYFLTTSGKTCSSLNSHLRTGQSP